MMDFSTEPPDLRTCLCQGVLNSSSYEYKQFRFNLDQIIKANIKETGIDPRVNGPPDHIKQQVISNQTVNEDPLKKKKIARLPPTHLTKQTISTLKKTTHNKLRYHYISDRTKSLLENATNHELKALSVTEDLLEKLW